MLVGLDNIVPAEMKMIVDDVAEAVIDIAKAKGAEAIVVGKRGAGPVGRFLLGSASRKLVNLAPLPVVVVP
jgi:nucleotide-binding universal stress UspA family protein